MLIAVLLGSLISGGLVGYWAAWYFHRRRIKQQLGLLVGGSTGKVTGEAVFRPDGQMASVPVGNATMSFTPPIKPDVTQLPACIYCGSMVEHLSSCRLWEPF